MKVSLCRFPMSYGYMVVDYNGPKEVNSFYLPPTNNDVLPCLLIPTIIKDWERPNGIYMTIVVRDRKGKTRLFATEPMKRDFKTHKGEEVEATVNHAKVGKFILSELRDKGLNFEMHLDVCQRCIEEFAGMYDLNRRDITVS